MSEIKRFGVSLEDALLERFDRYLREKGYTNRSEAIRDLIRNSLVEDEWKKKKDVSGAITIVYDHHRRELVNTVLDIQHRYSDMIVASQHVHLDHHNCLEVVIVKGRSDRIRFLYDRLRATKGVKHGALTLTTLGKSL